MPAEWVIPSQEAALILTLMSWCFTLMSEVFPSCLRGSPSLGGMESWSRDEVHVLTV